MEKWLKQPVVWLGSILVISSLVFLPAHLCEWLILSRHLLDGS